MALPEPARPGWPCRSPGELDDLGARAQALTISARTLAEMGQSEAAQVAASEALAAAQAVGHWTQRSAVLTGMVSAFARIGQIGLAVQAARAIDLRSGMQSLVRAVELLALTGHDGPALAVARQLGDPEMQARVLAISAQALVGTGQMEAARAAATEAHAVAREIRDLDSRARILADAAGVLVETGQMEAARAAAGEAQTAAREIDSPEPRARILADAAKILVKAGQPGAAQAAAAEACAMASEVDNLESRALILADAAGVLADVSSRFQDYPGDGGGRRGESEEGAQAPRPPRDRSAWPRLSCPR